MATAATTACHDAAHVACIDEPPSVWHVPGLPKSSVALAVPLQSVLPYVMYVTFVAHTYLNELPPPLWHWSGPMLTVVHVLHSVSVHDLSAAIAPYASISVTSRASVMYFMVGLA